MSTATFAPSRRVSARVGCTVAAILLLAANVYAQPTISATPTSIAPGAAVNVASLGATTHEVSATDEIWKFFAAHERMVPSP